jgi:hypothetical protein
MSNRATIGVDADVVAHRESHIIDLARVVAATQGEPQPGAPIVHISGNPVKDGMRVSCAAHRHLAEACASSGRRRRRLRRPLFTFRRSGCCEVASERFGQIEPVGDDLVEQIATVSAFCEQSCVSQHP